MNVPRLNCCQIVWSVIDLPTLEGWKTELTYMDGYILRWFTCPQTVTHPSTNLAQGTATSTCYCYATPPTQMLWCWCLGVSNHITYRHILLLSWHDSRLSRSRWTQDDSSSSSVWTLTMAIDRSRYRSLLTLLHKKDKYTMMTNEHKMTIRASSHGICRINRD